MAKPQKSSLYDYGNEYIPFRTKSSGLYRHRDDLGLHKVSYKERNLHIRSPSLLSTQRRVPSGHGKKSSVFYLHSPSVRPMLHSPDSRGPLIRDSLSSLVTQCVPMLYHMKHYHRRYVYLKQTFHFLQTSGVNLFIQKQNHDILGIAIGIVVF